MDGSEGCCCKKNLNTTNYERRTRVYNPNTTHKSAKRPAVARAGRQLFGLRVFF